MFFAATESLLSDLALTGFTVLLTGVAGAGLATLWSLFQKRKEMDLSAAEKFFDLYGEFLAVWRQWNHAVKNNATPPEEVVAKLYRQATRAEANLEALFVRLACQRRLSKATIQDLGRFRQGYQTLRSSISHRRPIPWMTSDQQEYKAFKSLTPRIAALIQSGGNSVPSAALREWRPSWS